MLKKNGKTAFLLFRVGGEGRALIELFLLLFIFLNEIFFKKRFLIEI